MFEFTSAQWELWASTFLWPFFRITAFLVAAPLLGHSSIPTKVKVGLGALLTLVIAPVIPTMPDIPVFSYAAFAIIAQQIMIGLALGLVMRIMFTVVQASGEYIGMQMGLGFAILYSPDTSMSNAMLSRFFYMIALLMFLALNGHMMVIEVLLGTFERLPIGRIAINPDAWKLVALYASTIFSAGMLLALPLLASLLLMNLAMGILNRSAPQITIFSIGFPITMLAGLVLLMLLMYSLGDFLERLFESAMIFLDALIHTLSSRKAG